MSSSPSPPKLSQSYIDEFIGYKLTDTAIAFIVLETVFVVLRCWSRYLQKASIGWDDILIIPAYLFCLGPCISSILAVKYGGVGHHIDALMQVAPEKLYYWGRSCLIAIPVLYIVSTTLPKLVILTVYLRIFVHKWSRISCYVIGAVLVASCILNMILSIWQCSPPDYVWNKTIPNGFCRDNVQVHFRWGTFANIVTDVAMLILPLPVIWGLQIPPRVKIGLTVTFIIGSIGLTTSIVRFAEFLGTAAFDDGTWASVKLALWACVEPGVYLFAACLLACRPLLHRTLLLRAGLWSRVGADPDEELQLQLQRASDGGYDGRTTTKKDRQAFALQQANKEACICSGAIDRVGFIDEEYGTGGIIH
ncbi:MAG: hypothetical protein ASARMPREDX12_008376 [Alectoria sarmentosa]|nr:MAG: hypothetical protein ASARMPREDX12_008376 [Alectoria sarmentosa]